jgi:hypothetical protein
MKGVWRKTIGGLKPADALAEEVWQQLPLNAEVMAEVTRPRSLQHHKWFFALLNLIYENQEEYDSLDALLIAVKVALGHCYPMITRTGQHVMVPKSIAFHKMDETQFRKFSDDFVHLVVTKWLKGVSEEELRAEVLTRIS